MVLLINSITGGLTKIINCNSNAFVRGLKGSRIEKMRLLKKWDIQVWETARHNMFILLEQAGRIFTADRCFQMWCLNFSAEAWNSPRTEKRVKLAKDASVWLCFRIKHCFAVPSAPIWQKKNKPKKANSRTLLHRFLWKTCRNKQMLWKTCIYSLSPTRLMKREWSTVQVPHGGFISENRFQSEWVILMLRIKVR